MFFINSFLYCGLICVVAQIILDNTKLTVGHITSIFVVIGSILEAFNIYDKIIKIVGGGALLPIVSFGHSLTHAVVSSVEKHGLLGLFTGVFDLTAGGISAAIIFSFVFYLICKPKN